MIEPLLAPARGQTGSPAPAAAYLRWKRWIDRTAGCVMGLLGIKLVLTRPEA
jgi:threonine/homoserine/homoserine lactone efflux protein